MNVLEADAGRDVKDFKASLIATNTLVVLTLRSDLKVLSSRLKVFSFAVRDTAAAYRVLVSCWKLENGLRIHGVTIVYHDTWLSRDLTDFRKDFND